MTDRLLPHDAALERLAALHPKRIDLSLGRMERLCAALGNPERRLPPIVHVAGTNGKGSTVAFLRAMAEAAGLSVHVYTSPHLVRFAERIRLAGRLIAEDRLAEVLDRVEAANAGEPITFFEVTTAAAFVAFAETPADLCLLEVGLGGRLDATNAIPAPRLSVITPVDMDHKEFLGDTIERIAAEKAGILKRGVPAVIGRHRPEALEVIERAAERLSAPLTVLGRDFDAWAERGGLAVQLPERLLDLPAPALAGAHQIDNAGVAVACAAALNLPEAAAAEGLRRAVWPARVQRLTAGPLHAIAAAAGADLWLDGGHNPHAAAALARTLEDGARRDGRPVVLIAGMLGNKDAAGFFAAFRDLNPRVLTVGFDSPAACPPEDLAEVARSRGLVAEAATSLQDAVQKATAGTEPPPRVMICGSLYLAGEVLALSPHTYPT